MTPPAGVPWRRGARAVALRVLLALAACAPPSQVVQVVPGRAPGRPGFVIPIDAGTFYGMAVTRCGEAAPIWQFGTGGGVIGRVPSTIIYGELPTGFALLAGPDPLTPGCYVVYASGAVGRFTVRPDGVVVPEARR